MARKTFPLIQVELAQPGALTPRRGQVFEMAANGYTSQEIADRLGISLDTVNCHLDALKDQFCAMNRSHLISQGWMHGIFQARSAVRALALVLALLAAFPMARVNRQPPRTASRTEMRATRTARREVNLTRESVA